MTKDEIETLANEIQKKDIKAIVKIFLKFEIKYNVLMKFIDNIDEITKLLEYLCEKHKNIFKYDDDLSKLKEKYDRVLSRK